MNRAFFALALVAACSSTPSLVEASSDDLTLVATIGPQSFTHGNLTAAAAQLAYAFNGTAGDTIAPDVWPTGKSTLTPTLTLLGPKDKSGRRSAIATGNPRGRDPRHLAIDGFRLPRAGNYLAVVGRSGVTSGQFTLRLWMQSSHLPRQESSQVDLSPTPSPAMVSAQQSHQQSPRPWTDPEVDGLVAGMRQQTDLRTAFADAQCLLSALVSAKARSQATDAQIARVRAGAAALVGTQQHFRALDQRVQAFALWWLGGNDALLFTSAPAPAPRAIGDTVAALVAAWPGAIEDRAARAVQAKTLDGVIFGWQADWSAGQNDTDGAAVWIDFAREWFDSGAHWLGEQSAGASEAEDD
jgi:hypothetical protein